MLLQLGCAIDPGGSSDERPPQEEASHSAVQAASSGNPACKVKSLIAVSYQPRTSSDPNAAWRIPCGTNYYGMRSRSSYHCLPTTDDPPISFGQPNISPVSRNTTTPISGIFWNSPAWQVDGALVNLSIYVFNAEDLRTGSIHRSWGERWQRHWTSGPFDTGGGNLVQQRRTYDSHRAVLVDFNWTGRWTAQFEIGFDPYTYTAASLGDSVACTAPGPMGTLAPHVYITAATPTSDFNYYIGCTTAESVFSAHRVVTTIGVNLGTVEEYFADRTLARDLSERGGASTTLPTSYFESYFSRYAEPDGPPLP